MVLMLIHAADLVGDVIATADDYGMVRLYKFPALRGQGKGKGDLPP